MREVDAKGVSVTAPISQGPASQIRSKERGANLSRVKKFDRSTTE